MEKEVFISVVIPVKNGDSWLNETISSILNQEVDGAIEIIAIDSGSTDDSLSILSKYPVTIININPEDFNHGLTRNLGAKLAKGKYIVMTVQDAKPANEKWLQYLLEGFDDDNVAGVCGQQIVPHDTDKNPIDWFRPISKPGKRKYFFKDVREFDNLKPEEKKTICSWDDVNAMYRKDILLQIPFRDVSFGEDALWAKDAIQNGLSIVYNTNAQVKHYHHETVDYTFRRSLSVHYYFYKLFGLKPKVNGYEFLHIIRNIKLLLFEKKVSWKNKLKWLIYNYKLRKASNKSITYFNKTLTKGERYLDEIHEIISMNPVQAIRQ
ncbi:MAG: glycosyltransferase family 2 protein [Chitinophagaceae bacterium]